MQHVIFCFKLIAFLCNPNLRDITRNIEENEILHEIFRIVSRFLRYISCYISENRLSLGHCSVVPSWSCIIYCCSLLSYICTVVPSCLTVYTALLLPSCLLLISNYCCRIRIWKNCCGSIDVMGSEEYCTVQCIQ